MKVFIVKTAFSLALLAGIPMSGDGQCISQVSGVFTYQSNVGTGSNCVFTFSPSFTIQSQGGGNAVKVVIFNIGSQTVCYTGTPLTIQSPCTGRGYTSIANGSYGSSNTSITLTLPCTTEGYTWSGSTAATGNSICASGSDLNPLPVNLLSFVASKAPHGINLNWITSNESNSQLFVIQQSYDAKEFEDIGEVAAVGNSTEAKSYFFAVPDNDSRVTYFRLKQIDIDKSFSFSKIISVTNETLTDDVIVFPNPISGNKVLLKGIKEEVMAVDLVCFKGRKQSLSFLKDGIILDIFLPYQLANGYYLLHISTKNSIITKRVIVNND